MFHGGETKLGRNEVLGKRLARDTPETRMRITVEDGMLRFSRWSCSEYKAQDAAFERVGRRGLSLGCWSLKVREEKGSVPGKLLPWSFSFYCKFLIILQGQRQRPSL